MVSLILLRQIPHPPPRIEYGAGSDLPLARGAKRLRSAKGEEHSEFPPLQGEGQPCTTWGSGQSPEPNMVQGVGFDGLFASHDLSNYDFQSYNSVCIREFVSSFSHP